jgi:hypothetical protein
MNYKENVNNYFIEVKISIKNKGILKVFKEY